MGIQSHLKEDYLLMEMPVPCLSLEDSLEKEMSNHSLQCSCLENPLDRETWWVAKSQT